MSSRLSSSHIRSGADLIADEARWTQKCMARTVSGCPCHPSDDKAARWCAEGSIYYFVGGLDIALELHVIDPAARSLSDINDNAGRAEAIAEMRRLADLAEIREQLG